VPRCRLLQAPSTADSERSASTRISSSVSTNLPSSGDDRGQHRARRARVALRQRANGGKPRRAIGARELHRACVSVKSPLILRVRFLAERRRDRRQGILVGAVCSSLAAASRTALSGDESLNDAMAVASVLRSRLLTTTSSRLSGSGDTACPVAASTALSPVTMSTVLSPTVCHVAVDQRLQERQRRGVAARHERANRLRAPRRPRRTRGRARLRPAAPTPPASPARTTTS
jgi:hypothetical protein